ncbi:GTPase IMAP family member 7-like isoform X1 [Biomphalaria pfeifferi]|uniref:GTPase IMAP family member 7-like isoform X1 n=1 Tax=Biomphalaria pfeifferi TaxID=112525 RepID=A0AAD8F0H0_BIOPF|nr:GTPase IMAP family member 7-like isoform X1 [Biomphalaria pfeifferi]
MKQEIAAVLEDVNIADQGTDALANVKSFVQRFLYQIDDKIENLNDSLNIKEKKKKLEDGSEVESDKDLAKIKSLETEIQILNEKGIKMKEEMSNKIKSLEDDFKEIKQEQTAVRINNCIKLIKSVWDNFGFPRPTEIIIQLINNFRRKQ